ncbi:MAG: hypothetical protein LBH07_01490 [Treponema sp.]|jgi:hypothetical protein|nr:hypothetical protein [Treponema sp.]
MPLEITYKQSAFKHKATKADILWAFNTAKYDYLVAGFDNKYLLIGFNTSGNLLEIMYNDLGDGKVSVFHAMPCRNALLSLLDKRSNR